MSKTILSTSDKCNSDENQQIISIDLPATSKTILQTSDKSNSNVNPPQKSSCEGERSFSALKHIKNPHRSTMNQDRLNGLSALLIHRQETNNCMAPGGFIDQVIDNFAQDMPRRLPLL